MRKVHSAEKCWIGARHRDFRGIVGGGVLLEFPEHGSDESVFCDSDCADLLAHGVRVIVPVTAEGIGASNRLTASDEYANLPTINYQIQAAGYWELTRVDDGQCTRSAPHGVGWVRVRTAPSRNECAAFVQLASLQPHTYSLKLRYAERSFVWGRLTVERAEIWRENRIVGVEERPEAHDLRTFEGRHALAPPILCSGASSAPLRLSIVGVT